ncbi:MULTISPECIES: DUF4326 domain-containing protein [unclassified Nonomuraea]|uniref:DUF4326 domain-containing protein n=1 Tax=unclassified Nonomuraea TaxID=2593643 RepID=UPI0033E17903
MGETPKPQRIQRRRTKGWTMPEGAVYVGRPTRFGNHIRITRRKFDDERNPMWHVTGSPRYLDGPAFNLLFTARVEATKQFEADLLRWRDIEYPSIEEIRAVLAGRDLACWCPLPEWPESDWCHARVLLEIANGEPDA